METVLLWGHSQLGLLLFLKTALVQIDIFFLIAVKGIFFLTLEINTLSFKFENGKKVFVHIIQYQLDLSFWGSL